MYNKHMYNDIKVTNSLNLITKITQGKKLTQRHFHKTVPDFLKWENSGIFPLEQEKKMWLWVH